MADLLDDRRSASESPSVTVMSQSDATVERRISEPLPTHHDGPTLNVTSVLGRTISRKLGWSWITVAVSVIIISVAAATLFRLSRQIELGAVVAALKAQSSYGLLVAGGFVVAGYLMLSCYDVFALRAIDR